MLNRDIKGRPLTPAEVAVMRNIANGCCAKRIATETNRSTYTIKRHALSVRLKLGAKTTPHAVAMLCCSGVIKCDGGATC